ncbi:FAD-dependent oxidoreductase [bacterium]|nr:FAD-dependent oxidoreductase [bacterium]
MKKYDVVIFGGGTAGCACAWNCGKLGLKTLLIEKESYLGGTITGSLVIPVMKSGENQINTDFYNELVKKMNYAGGQVTYQNNSGWFNPFILKNVLFKLLLEQHVDINLNQDLSVYNETIHTNNNWVIKSNILSVYIESKYVVDATGDLYFCKKNNCEFLEQKQELPPPSLRFIMDGIDLEKFGNWLQKIDSNRDVTTVEKIYGCTHLSTAYTWDTDKHWALAPYFEAAINNNDLKPTDCNYFQVFTVAGLDGALAFNCPRILDKENPLKAGKESIYRLAKFCKKYFPGFENSKILKIAEKLGIRASCRIKGKYIYTIEDLRSGKKFKNPAVISNYPVDIHSSKKNNSTLEITGEYQLPIESLMVDNYDNLFVAGRGLSSDEFAQGALRVQASCFSMGEAVAKYIKSSIHD